MGVAERRAREKEQRRKTIIDAAEQVFFAKGVDQATMDDVADTAELSKGLLYFYFKNKMALYHAICLRGLHLIRAGFEKAIANHETGLEQIQAVGLSYIEFFESYPNYFHFIAQDNHHMDPACDAATIEIKNLVASVIQNGIHDGSIRPDLDPQMTGSMLWAFTAGLMQVVKNKNHEHLFDSNQLIAYAMNFLRDSLSP